MTPARPWLVAVATAVLLLAAATAAAATSRGCGSLDSGRCGVTTAGSHFHGLIAVGGSPWVLDDAAHAGARPGCGDCRWSLVLACPKASPTDPATSKACAGAGDSPTCRPGERLYRVYLSTDVELDRVQGTVCLGGADQVVAVGTIARADVERYLRNVTPPPLRLRTRPAGATLAGLPTYFSATPPRDLAPVPFGGPTVTETITIRPVGVAWRWGDGSASGWTSSAGTETHSYRRGGTASGTLTTRWGATYTVTYAGAAYGPYDAARRLTQRQPFGLPVHTSSPVLVSR
jgi:hypothetical protein